MPPINGPRGGLCLADSCEYAIEELGLSVVNALEGLPTGQFNGPGSIVRIARGEPEDGRSLTLGLPDEVSASLGRSLAFVPPKAEDVRVIMRYASPNPLESGWLLGPDRLQGKVAVVATPWEGQGRIILFGSPPRHRVQTHGTVRLPSNALL